MDKPTSIPIRGMEELVSTSFQQLKTVSSFFLPDKMRVAIDVGGHVGTWAIHLVEQFDKLYIVEPIPTNLQLLSEYFSTYENVTIVHGAASDRTGFAPFTVCTDVNMACSGLAREKLLKEQRTTHNIVASTFRLDDIIPPTEIIDFIKIDADGHDLKVLRGAIRILQQHHPLIYVEVKFQKEEIREFLRGQDYKLIKKIRNNDVWKYREA